MDSAVSPLWVSTALGVIALPGQDGREPESGLPRAQAERMVRGMLLKSIQDFEEAITG
jgi:hypothetical protein